MIENSDLSGKKIASLQQVKNPDQMGEVLAEGRGNVK